MDAIMDKLQSHNPDVKFKLSSDVITVEVNKVEMALASVLDDKYHYYYHQVELLLHAIECAKRSRCKSNT